MLHDFLIQIVEYKKELNQRKSLFYQRIKEQLATTTIDRYHVFQDAIKASSRMNLIAEIKKASPSQGLIREDFDVLRLAKIYQTAGAQALSILTEDRFFLGNPLYIKQVSGHCRLPILTKDFIIEEGQIYEAVCNGASAILLIVAILSDPQIKGLMDVAHRFDMDCLVEVHDQSELDRALSVGAQIIGINHRDLHTFEVDFRVSERLIPRIPRDKIIVAESGFKTHDDVRRLQELGAHAVLIGETFMRDPEILPKVREVMEGVRS
jgi:indole-3-glycerol phosphate synthase